MAPKIKGVDGVKMKRTKVSRISAGGHCGAAALQISKHERELARIAAEDRKYAVRKNFALIHQKRVMENEFIFKQVTEREAFGPLGVMCEPQEVSWDWDMAKRVYNFIRNTVEFGLNFPGHMLVLQSVVDAQKALVEVYPRERDLTLWEVCLALEHRGSNDTELWSRGIERMNKMISEWKEESYDVDYPPLFKELQILFDEDPNEPTPMCFDTWKTNDPVQAEIFSRMYAQLVSGHDDKEVAREWELRHDIKKALHALKTIAQL